MQIENVLCARIDFQNFGKAFVEKYESEEPEIKSLRFHIEDWCGEPNLCYYYLEDTEGDNSIYVPGSDEEMRKFVAPFIGFIPNKVTCDDEYIYFMRV